MKHARYYWLVLAKAHLAWRRFGSMPWRMAGCRFADRMAGVEGRREGRRNVPDNQWIPQFLDYCKKNAVAVDFVSMHHPNDAFGKPGADTMTQLEHAPRGVMKDQASNAHNEAGDLPLYYTEWNISSNPRDPLHDEPFAAALATRIIMEARGLVQGLQFLDLQ